MKNGTLQALEALLLVGLGAGTHIAIARLRRPLFREWEEAGSGTVRALAGVVDLVLALVYGAFISAVLSVGGSSYQVSSLDQVLDVTAFFALFLATIHVVALVVLRTIIQSLEPWASQDPQQSQWA